MMPRSQVMNWLMSLPLDAVIAINQDGLRLIEVGGKGYLELGGDLSAPPEASVGCEHRWTQYIVNADICGRCGQKKR
jgi:hypothetical protein